MIGTDGRCVYVHKALYAGEMGCVIFAGLGMRLNAGRSLATVKYWERRSCGASAGGPYSSLEVQ